MPPSRRSFEWWLLCFLMFLSGTAALGYEISWMRMLALGLGHEMPAAAAVVCALFGGLAVGAWVLDRRLRQSKSPARWYAGLEATIAAWALVSMFAIPWLNDRIGWLTGAAPGYWTHWVVAFVVPFAILSPATVAMGATLPAMDRLVEGVCSNGRSIGAIYAANTLGAVTGTLGTTFILLPILGFRWTLTVLASLSFSCAVVTLVCFAGRDVPLNSKRGGQPTNEGQTSLAATLLITGLLGIGYELLGTRVMAQVLENTAYSFASILSMYLLGTSLGAAAYQRFLRDVDPDRLLGYLLNLLCFTCLLGVLVLSRARQVHEATLDWLGPGIGSAVAGEMLLAFFVFGAATFCMGATFSLLAQMYRNRVGSVGRAFGINTLGAAIAAPLFVPGLLPLLGAKWALTSVCLGYLLLLPQLRDRVSRIRRGRESSAIEPSPNHQRGTVSMTDLPPMRRAGVQRRLADGLLLLATAIVLWMVTGSDLMLVQPLEGGEVLEYREGVMAAVSVVTDGQGNRFLKVNDRFRMGSTANPANERRLGHIPLLLHARPQRALFLGLGTGSTLAAAKMHSGVQAVAVELLPEIIAVQHHFSEATGDLQSSESLTIRAGDARRYVRASRESYDVIVADLFHPARDGSGALYTREHFRAVRQRLSNDGLFCQWLPLYQLDEYCLRTIVRTFLEVFPQADAYLSHFDVNMPILGLVGSVQPRRYSSDWFERRVKDRRLQRELRQLGLTNGLTMFGLSVASSQRLRSLSGDGPINSDDRPLVTFAAPRFIYGRRPAGFVNLQLLLDSEETSATEHITTDPAFGEQLAHFMAARDIFLRAEVRRASGDLSKAVDGYLEAVKTSRDFELAYVMALLQAKRLADAGKPSTAIEILERINTANPSGAEAKAMLHQLRAK